MRRLWLAGLAAAIGTFTFSGCIRHTVHAQVFITSHVVSSTSVEPHGGAAALCRPVLHPLWLFDGKDLSRKRPLPGSFDGS